MVKTSWPEVPTKFVERCTVESLKERIVYQLYNNLAKDRYVATQRDFFLALAYTVRQLLIERWIRTQKLYHDKKPKRVYYLSMEYLIGRTLESSLVNLGLHETASKALAELGLNLKELADCEWDAALGNGGLGRLAACFLDSMATLDLPAYGYGLRYDFGIFFQKIRDGYQMETPDNWLRYGNPWEMARPEYLYPVHFGGRVISYSDHEGRMCNEWVDTEEVVALAHDTPVPGYDTETVNTLRLWSARSSRGFDLGYFQHGDYIRALQDKILTENITRVLYPDDSQFVGRELRLKQEYFLVSATLQDIVRRHKKDYKSLDNFAEKNAIQLNDTHPSLAIPEFMRQLIDCEGYGWDSAWRICVETFSYTNHTIMPEALERWPVSLMENLLPRHLQIIYEINVRWLREVAKRFPGDEDRLRRMSLIEEGPEKMVRMAYLSLVGSHYVNGVSALHSNLIKTSLFHDFHDMLPLRFTNKTNGITPRRWLKQCNPELAKLISGHIGTSWPKHLEELSNLKSHADNKKLQKEWMLIKQHNKEQLARIIEKERGVHINRNSIFDVQVKRIHEYKRQLLNLFHAINFYNHIKDNPNEKVVPRTIIFAGKAAPAYFIAKLIIKLINNVGEVINHDPEVEDKLKVVFLENYRVSLAEVIMPATDLSEQISTAGTEASGTGNMKFALNGALTIGTLDGANIEIGEEVGKDNIFIFGYRTEEIAELKNNGYNPWDYYNNQPNLKRVMDQIRDGYFSQNQRDLFDPILYSLLEGGDKYCLLADFPLYIQSQKQVAKEYLNTTSWARKSILNVASMGKFSSDRTIKEYAEEIWDL